MGVVNDKSIQLEALERDAQVNRNLLEAMLNRAKQAATAGDALQANAKLISPAVPAAAPSFHQRPCSLDWDPLRPCSSDRGSLLYSRAVIAPFGDRTRSRI